MPDWSAIILHVAKKLSKHLNKWHSNTIGVTRGFALTTEYKNRLGTHTGEKPFIINAMFVRKLSDSLWATNPALTAKFFAKNDPFNYKLFFWLPWCKMVLVLLKKLLFFTQKIDFPKIRYKSAQYLKLVHAHKPKFGLRELRALCVKVVRSRGSGIIGVSIGNVLKQVSSISRRISVSNIKHQVSCKFIIRKL